MKTLIKTIALLLLVFSINACKTTPYSFIDNYPVKNLPLIDSTNFSNHIEGKLLTIKEQQLLNLKEIFADQLDSENAKIGISYRLKISENYTSIVYYFYPNNQELTSILVNYDTKFNIINSQVLAYDEITEGILKTTSKLSKNKIELTEYIEGTPSVLEFKIEDNGHITRE